MSTLYACRPMFPVMMPHRADPWRLAALESFQPQVPGVGPQHVVLSVIDER